MDDTFLHNPTMMLMDGPLADRAIVGRALGDWRRREGKEGRLRWKAPLRATSAPMDDAAAATADDEDEDVGHGRNHHHHHMSIWREERRRNKESQFRRQNITLGSRRMPHRKWI